MRAALWVVALALAGCGKVDAFVCESDQQCFDGANNGACEQSGFCSFPDATCPAGKRYGEYAGEGLGGSCVEGGDTGVTGGGSSGGACAEDCGPCATCEAGSCAPKTAGEGCELACEQFVFGPGEDPMRASCLAFASGAGTGSCDGAGACVFAEGACAAAGAEIVGCELACGRADHNCTPGAPVESVTVATFCAAGTTDMCKGTCADVMGSPSQLSPRACDGGKCVDGMGQDCGGYTCADTLDACRTMCSKQSECAQSFMCSMDGVCQ